MLYFEAVSIGKSCPQDSNPGQEVTLRKHSISRKNVEKKQGLADLAKLGRFFGWISQIGENYFFKIGRYKRSFRAPTRRTGGQGQSKPRPFPRFGFDGNFSTVALDELFGDVMA